MPILKPSRKPGNTVHQGETERWHLQSSAQLSHLAPEDHQDNEELPSQPHGTSVIGAVWCRKEKTEHLSDGNPEILRSTFCHRPPPRISTSTIAQKIRGEGRINGNKPTMDHLKARFDGCVRWWRGCIVEIGRTRVAKHHWTSQNLTWILPRRRPSRKAWRWMGTKPMEYPP